VKDIIIQETTDIIVVVSALGGVTDLILKAARVAAAGTEDYHPVLAEIKDRHIRNISEFFNATGTYQIHCRRTD
jgi:bifunctional aspartokinase / homoserine dehydrogenase 1